MGSIKNFPVGADAFKTIYAINLLKNEKQIINIKNLILANDYEQALEICNK